MPEKPKKGAKSSIVSVHDDNTVKSKKKRKRKRFSGEKIVVSELQQVVVDTELEQVISSITILLPQSERLAQALLSQLLQESDFDLELSSVGDLRAFLIQLQQNLKQPESLKNQLWELANKGAVHGIQVEHYRAIIDYFVTAIAEVLAEQWTPEINAAWSTTIQKVTDIMMAPVNKSDPVPDLASKTESASLHHQLLQCLTTPLALVDNDWIILYANSALVSLIGSQKSQQNTENSEQQINHLLGQSLSQWSRELEHNSEATPSQYHDAEEALLMEFAGIRYRLKLSLLAAQPGHHLVELFQHPVSEEPSTTAPLSSATQATIKSMTEMIEGCLSELHILQTDYQELMTNLTDLQSLAAKNDESGQVNTYADTYQQTLTQQISESSSAIALLSALDTQLFKTDLKALSLAAALSKLSLPDDKIPSLTSGVIELIRKMVSTQTELKERLLEQRQLLEATHLRFCSPLEITSSKSTTLSLSQSLREEIGAIIDKVAESIEKNTLLTERISQGHLTMKQLDKLIQSPIKAGVDS